MASSRFVNTLQVDFASVRAMEHKWQICVLGTSLWQSAVVIVVIVAQRFEMPRRRRDRGRGHIPEESEGQTEVDQCSSHLRGRGRRDEDEVDELAARVNDMELVMARFQHMNPQVFNGDE
ncbi:hypothetical protein F511_19887 [Dorcoceras hygrometricum]|uniref:Uncharacterized protein n=1 Tax=Dorcoceras hygrometricum TaxID=472368 RepID=A0A2Z7BJS2_9LAMI|nr:hypothetical protein F511_19887 [Dorcoceras hygrometricum]